MVFWQWNWSTMCSGKTCFTTDTLYSVSSSVSGAGSLLLNSLPSAASAGTAASSSAFSLADGFASARVLEALRAGR